jgi:hypothetical protein
MGADNLMELIEAGKIDEVKALLKVQIAKAKFEPDEIRSGTDRKAKFYKRGRRVEKDENGEWQLLKKQKSPATE